MVLPGQDDFPVASPNSKAYYRRGEALRRLDRLLEAVVALSEGVALDPPNNLIVDSLIEASQKLFSEFQYLQNRAIIENFPLKRLESLGLERDRFTVLTMVGQELASAEHPREASKVLTRALNLHSPSLRLRESAISALASVHYLLGEYQKATLYYEKQLDIRSQLEGSLAEVHDNIATSAELAGNYVLALSHRKQRRSDRIADTRKRLDGVIRFSPNVSVHGRRRRSR
ncbi:tetratricopeptide repeat protein [Cooperia oncophora]